MIRKISRVYVDEILELHKDAIFPLWDKLNLNYSEEGVKTFILGVFMGGEVYGYFENKEFLGVIGVEENEKFCEVSFLLVNSNFQGRGIGRKLLSFIENKSHKKMVLDVLVK